LAIAWGELAGSKWAKAPMIKTAPAPMATNQAETGKIRVFILIKHRRLAPGDIHFYC
jgi:hypothetical protein